MTEERNYPINTTGQQESAYAAEQDLFGPAQLPAATSFGLRFVGADKLNILLVASFIAAIGGLYLLGSRTALAKASAEQQVVDGKIELALATFQAPTGNKKTHADEKLIIKRTLNYEVADCQVPLPRLTGNPFVYELARASANSPGAGATGARPGGYYGESTDVNTAMAAAESLKLQSVLASTNGAIALVNDRLLRVGETIEGWQVTDIRPRSVTLKWKTRTHTLHMPEHTGFGGN